MTETLVPFCQLLFSSCYLFCSWLTRKFSFCYFLVTFSLVICFAIYVITEGLVGLCCFLVDQLPRVSWWFRKQLFERFEATALFLKPFRVNSLAVLLLPVAYLNSKRHHGCEIDSDYSVYHRLLFRKYRLATADFICARHAHSEPVSFV